jgi:hypothetical protein
MRGTTKTAPNNEYVYYLPAKSRCQWSGFHLQFLIIRLQSKLQFLRKGVQNMAPIFYFGVETDGTISGSSFGEPDGTKHEVELLEGEGHMILRVTLAESEKSVDLLFTDKQAISFTEATKAILRRLNLDR